MQLRPTLSFSITPDQNFNVFVDPNDPEYVRHAIHAILPQIPTQEEFDAQEKFLAFDRNGGYSQQREILLSCLNRIQELITPIFALSCIAFSLSSLAPYTFSALAINPYLMGSLFALFALSHVIKNCGKSYFQSNRCTYTTYLESQAQAHVAAREGSKVEVENQRSVLIDKECQAISMLFMHRVPVINRNADLFKKANQAYNAYVIGKIDHYLNCDMADMASFVTAIQYAHQIFDESVKITQIDKIYRREAIELCKVNRFQEALEVASHISEEQLRNRSLHESLIYCLQSHAQGSDQNQVLTNAKAWMDKITDESIRNELKKELAQAGYEIEVEGS